MSIRPTDLPVSLPREIPPVRRVEANSGSQDFGQRSQPENDHGEHRSDQDDSPVAVELSAEYLSSSKDSDSDTAAAGLEKGSENDSVHLDIEA